MYIPSFMADFSHVFIVVAKAVADNEQNFVGRCFWRLTVELLYVTVQALPRLFISQIFLSCSLGAVRGEFLLNEAQAWESCRIHASFMIGEDIRNSLELIAAHCAINDHHGGQE